LGLPQRPANGRAVLATCRKLGLAKLVAWGVTALATPSAAYSLQLDWDAPRSCPDLVALRSSIERLLREPLVEGTTVRVSAIVTEDGDQRFTLTLTIRAADAEGTRSVRTDTCESALEVAAFSIALALNPDLHVHESPRAAAPSKSQADQAGSPSTAPNAPPTRVQPAAPAAAASARPRTTITPNPLLETSHRAAAPARQRPPGIWLGAHALADSSLLPSPAVGLAVGAEVGIVRGLRAGVRPALFLPQDERLDSGAGGLFSLWSAQVYACAEIRTTIAVCPLFQYGVVHAEGRGAEPTLEQWSRIYAPGLAVLGSYSLSQGSSARVALTGLSPLFHDIFVVQEGEVHRIPPISIELSLGIVMGVF
jgi:hypothetical protein